MSRRRSTSTAISSPSPSSSSSASPSLRVQPTRAAKVAPVPTPTSSSSSSSSSSHPVSKGQKRRRDSSTSTKKSSSQSISKSRSEKESSSKNSRRKAAEPEVDEEEDEDVGDSADEEDDDSANDDDSEGELVFCGTTGPNGEWLAGSLTYDRTKRVHYSGLFQNGEMHGDGELFFPDGSSLRGTFVNGEIRGQATYTGEDSSRVVGHYSEGGILEGEVVEYDDDGVEVFRGQYRDSVRHGPGVLTQPDGGKLVGEFVDGTFHGDANKYVYPPGLGPSIECSLRGRWVDGVLESARFYENERLHQPEVSYRFDESTATRISSQPMLPDPYEQLCVYVKMSTTPDSGEGLFALRDLPPNTIVTWYSGTRDKGYKAERRKWSENSNTISLIDDDPDAADIDIDVSEKWSSTSKYCASLAHKCNHSFDPTKQNAKYDMALHPRFGLIKSIRTLRAVKKDEELFVNYGYSLQLDPKTGLVKGNSKAGPAWYRNAHDHYWRGVSLEGRLAQLFPKDDDSTLESSASQAKDNEITHPTPTPNNGKSRQTKRAKRK